MKKTLKYIGIAIAVYAFFYFIGAFIIWDLDLSTMHPADRGLLAFLSTLAVGAIIYFNEIPQNI